MIYNNILYIGFIITNFDAINSILEINKEKAYITKCNDGDFSKVL